MSLPKVVGHAKLQQGCLGVGQAGVAKKRQEIRMGVVFGLFWKFVERRNSFSGVEVEGVVGGGRVV